MNSRFRITDAAAQSAPASMAAFLALGFRPFFFTAALMATVWMAVWIAVLRGWLPLPADHIIAWHGHEMVYGYTVAVIAGFLLTAVRNWTGVATPSGGVLAVLVVVWAAGRAALLAGGVLPGWAVAGVDLAFLPLLIAAIAVPLLRSGNRRNYGFVPLLTVLWLANLLFHWKPEAASTSLQVAVDVVTLVIIVIGGRVIPFFTRNALGVEVRSDKLSDWGSFVTTAVLLVLTMFSVDANVLAGMAIAAGVLNLWRMRGWQSMAAMKRPILGVLHVGYAWVGAALLLRGVALAGWPAASSAALHAMTAGAIGTLTLGMMSRVALGHTGRMIVASTAMKWAYVLVTAAALVRTAGVLVYPGGTAMMWAASGLFWAVAFVLYLLEFTPILWRPRPDGKPG